MPDLQINSAADWIAMNDLADRGSTSSKYNIYINADLDFSEYESYTGMLPLYIENIYGQGHTISGFTANHVLRYPILNCMENTSGVRNNIYDLVLNNNSFNISNIAGGGTGLFFQNGGGSIYNVLIDNNNVIASSNNAVVMVLFYGCTNIYRLGVKGNIQSPGNFYVAIMPNNGNNIVLESFVCANIRMINSQYNNIVYFYNASTVVNSFMRNTVTHFSRLTVGFYFSCDYYSCYIADTYTNRLNVQYNIYNNTDAQCHFFYDSNTCPNLQSNAWKPLTTEQLTSLEFMSEAEWYTDKMPVFNGWRGTGKSQVYVGKEYYGGIYGGYRNIANGDESDYSGLRFYLMAPTILGSVQMKIKNFDNFSNTFRLGAKIESFSHLTWQRTSTIVYGPQITLASGEDYDYVVPFNAVGTLGPFSRFTMIYDGIDYKNNISITCMKVFPDTTYNYGNPYWIGIGNSIMLYKQYTFDQNECFPQLTINATTEEYWKIGENGNNGYPYIWGFGDTIESNIYLKTSTGYIPLTACLKTDTNYIPLTFSGIKT